MMQLRVVGTSSIFHERHINIRMRNNKGILKFFLSVFCISWLFAIIIESYFSTFDLLNTALIAFCASFGALLASLVTQRIFKK